MDTAKELAALFARDLTRLIQEVSTFSVDQQHLLWEVRPGVSNSVGNLALHLEGNLREYVGRQLGGVAYTRDRPAEFSSKGVLSGQLATRLSEVCELVARVIAGLSPAQMDAVFPENILKAPRSTRQVLLHIYGHLSYHLGQIDYLRRLLTAGKPVDFAAL